MSEHLVPGTACYLVRLTDHADFIGRVVEVASGPLDRGEGVPSYAVTAEWLGDAFGSAEVTARRDQLLPISAPGLDHAVDVRDTVKQ